MNRGESTRSSRASSDHIGSQPYTRPNRSRHYELGNASKSHFGTSTNAANGNGSASVSSSASASGAARNQNKNRSHSGNENKDLLDKFELLGRERRGDVVSSYKAADDNSALEADWELPGDSAANEIAGSNSRVEEFEEWKRSMRRGAASDLAQKESEQHIPTMFDNDNMQQAATAINVDKVFDDDLISGKMSGVSVGAFSHKASRFSSFFKTENDQKQMLYPGSDNMPRFSGGMPAPPPPPPQQSEGDSNDFNRILAMLNNVNTQGGNQQPPASSVLPISEPQIHNADESNSTNDDAFFMSLLNKNVTTESAGETDGNSASMMQSVSSSTAVQSPVSEKVRSGSISQPELQVMSPSQRPNQIPGMPFPPPQEWLQAQANGQLPKLPPGVMPPMLGNMPPGMMPFPPGGMGNMPPNMMPPNIGGPNMPPGMGPNGMPLPPGMNHLPPHMMMPMPPGMPPFPPGGPMPMGFIQNMEEMNGQFGPRGGPPPMPGMPMGPFPGPPGLMSNGGVVMPGLPPNMSPMNGPPGLVNEGKGHPESK